MQYVIHDLVARTVPGRVYLGVGPEQNFTYISATKPSMAVIFDIRRGNLDLQLMYKAIFELSADRAEFVSMLFARPRPEGLSKTSTVREIFLAVGAVPPNAALATKHLAAIRTHLTKTHALHADLSALSTRLAAAYLGEQRRLADAGGAIRRREVDGVSRGVHDAPGHGRALPAHRLREPRQPLRRPQPHTASRADGDAGNRRAALASGPRAAGRERDPVARRRCPGGASDRGVHAGVRALDAAGDASARRPARERGRADIRHRRRRVHRGAMRPRASPASARCA